MAVDMEQRTQHVKITCILAREVGMCTVFYTLSND